VYRHYALDYADARVHFVLNTGDVACPQSVPVLRPQTVDEQLNAACAVFFANKQLVVDSKRRTVTLPKVCEVFRYDFGPGDSLSTLKFCVGGMDEDTAIITRMLLVDEHNLTVKFQHTSDQYHASLRLRKDHEPEETGFSTLKQLSSDSMDISI
jgi:hypothetical protein